MNETRIVLRQATELVIQDESGEVRFTVLPVEGSVEESGQDEIVMTVKMKLLKALPTT